MDDDLARRLDRISVLLGATLTVHVLILFMITDLSIAGLAAAFVVVGLLVALFGGLFIGQSPFRSSDRHSGSVISGGRLMPGADGRWGKTDAQPNPYEAGTSTPRI